MSEQPKKRGLLFALVPLALFLGLSAVLYSMLTKEGRDVSQVPSALLDTPAPKLALNGLEGLDIPGMSPDMFVGKLSVVNVFASWCVPCRQEHPFIEQIGALEGVQLVGINHRDSQENAIQFLNELGNPYDAIGVDRNARASIEWGVYGVPETFLVDRNGVIFHKHIGPINQSDFDKKILPLITGKLNQAN